MVKYARLELMAEYDSRDSFYNKAYVDVFPLKKILFSYGFEVMTISSRGEILDFPIEEDHLSQTTLRHIREFLRQEIDASKKWSKKEILEIKRNLEKKEEKENEDLKYFLDIFENKTISYFLTFESSIFIEKTRENSKNILIRRLEKEYEKILESLIIKDSKYGEELLFIVNKLIFYVENDLLSNYSHFNLLINFESIIEEISLEDNFSILESVDFFIKNYK